MTKSAAPRKLNVKLLRKVEKYILAEPNRFLMGDVCQIKDPRYPDWMVYDDSAKAAPEFEFAPCGTAACIAGWTLILSGKSPKQVSRLHRPLQTAARLLGITTQSKESLFLASCWPQNFRDKFETFKTPLARARVAVARIEHFIATKGPE